MASFSRHIGALASRRAFATATAASSASPEPLTHYKITLRRSAISLPAAFKKTLVSLGIHRRMQTVYHPHSQECAGKILKVKELVEVENVRAADVRSKTEQREGRKARRGYVVVSSKLERTNGLSGSGGMTMAMTTTEH